MGAHGRGYAYSVGNLSGPQRQVLEEIAPEPVERLSIAIDSLYRREIVHKDIWPDLHEVQRLIVAEVERITAERFRKGDQG